MLTRVNVLSENPFYLNIRDSRPSDSIIVEKIEGLNPPTIDLFMGDYARDGGYYSGRRVPPRDVTMTLLLNPNYNNNESVSGLRTMLYKAFMDPFVSGDNLVITLEDDELADRYISGFTEKFETDIFSDGTSVEVSFRCPNPYILDYSETVNVGSGPTVPFEYNGSAETGFIIRADIVASTSTLSFDLNGKIFSLSYSFLVGDKVLIDSRRGSRKIQVTRTTGGVTTTTDILYAKSSLEWLELHSKSNLLKAAGAGGTAVANITEIRFRGSHWGI